MRSIRKIGGFTLIELLIVVAIIAILAAIALPSYMNYVLRSKIRTAQADLQALSVVVENYRQRTLGYPDSADADNSGDRTKFEEFSGWSPASKAADFTFSYSSNADYTLSASGASGSKLSGCTLTITAGNARTNEGCTSFGDVSW